MRRVPEWTRSLGMSEIGWDTLNVLARGMGKNLTNRYPDGKLLAESLEHMLDHLTGMRLICATEYFQYSSIINTLKSYTPQTKKKNDEKNRRRVGDPITQQSTRKRSLSPVVNEEDPRRAVNTTTPEPNRKRSVVGKKDHRRSGDASTPQSSRKYESDIDRPADKRPTRYF